MTTLADVAELENLRLLFTPEQAAVVLSIGRSKVYDLMRRGELRSLRIGGSRRVSVTALREFVDRLEQACSEPVCARF